MKFKYTLPERCISQTKNFSEFRNGASQAAGKHAVAPVSEKNLDRMQEAADFVTTKIVSEA